MVAETDDKEERTEETEEPGETPSADSALIAWIGAIHSEIREVARRVGRLEERVARIEGGIESERDRKNRAIVWLSIGVGALVGLGGILVGVIGLLN